MRARVQKEINVIVGENIRKYREQAGYSREKFAELIDVSPYFIAEAERGYVGVSLTNIKKICEILGVSADRLLWNTENNVDLSERLAHVDEKFLPLIEEVLQKQLEVIALADKGENRKKTRN